MNINESERWNKDIDMVIRDLPELEELSGRSIMITGATGLICSAIVDIIIRYNETHGKSIVVFAAGRCKEKMIDRYYPFSNNEYFKFIEYDAIRTDNKLDDPADYIIHGASNAYPSKIIKEPVETMLCDFRGMSFLLHYAKEYGIKRVLYVSSSEVYGNKNGNQPFHEDEYGYIDLLNPRNSYSIGKRAAETLCISYAAEYGIETLIVRPGHIYGPTASSKDNRISSTFAHAAARGEDIELKSDGSQLRSYCYCLDCAAAMLKVLVKGENAHAYNISNPNSILSIRQMAEILAKAGEVNLIQSEASEREKRGFNPMNNSSLDSTGLMELGWKGHFDAETGFFHTVEILKETLIRKDYFEKV